LTRTLLGDSVADGLVAGIVDQAYGNAFVIEELVRRAVESGSAEVPETVLAIVSARLHALESEARLVLRAASVFGNVFWERGVAALLRGLGPEVDVQAWLEVLVAREVVTPERSTKFTGEGAYAFRHALLREGAYVMLTDADRRQGHLLAAGWLAGVGEKDALVVADHYEHALHAGQAVPWLLRAAEVALDGADIDVAIRIAARGLQGATGETRGMFLEIQQLACSFRGDWSGAFAAGAGAMSLLEPGTTRWFRSAGSAMLTGIYLGKPETTVDVLQRSAALPTPEPSGPFGLAMYMLVGTLLHAGAREMVLGLIDRLEAAARTQTDPDPAFAGWLGTTRCTAGLFLFDRVGPSLIAAQEAVRSFDGAADRVGWAAAALYCGIAHIEAGQPEAARHWLEEVVARSKDALLPTGDFARYYLARVEALRGNPAMAEALLQAPPGIADGARAFVAEALWRNGDVDGARREGQRVTSSASVYARVSGMSVLARIALHEGRAAEAISLLDRAIADQNAGSAAPFWRSILLLTRAEALDAAGDRQAARAAIAEANERLERIAAGFADPALRESYLTAIEENARTQALARAWRWRGPQR